MRNLKFQYSEVDLNKFNVATKRLMLISNFWHGKKMSSGVLQFKISVKDQLKDQLNESKVKKNK